MSKSTLRRIELTVGSADEAGGDLLVLALPRGVTELPAAIAPLFPAPADPVRVLLGSGDFRGELAEVHLAYGGSGPCARTLLVGMGEPAKWNAERLRATVAAAARRAQELAVGSLVLPLPLASGEPLSSQVETAAEALFLGTYRFDAPRAPETTPKEEVSLELARIVVPEDVSASTLQAALERGRLRAAATNLARDLGHTPANLMTPTILAERAARIAADQELGLTVLGPDEAAHLGMGAFLGVTQGSVEPPRMIFLHYTCPDPAAPTVALVGKGITFDTGGISLKPGAKMDEMKYDMCGAAAVLGAMSVVRALGVPVHVVAAVAAAENMPSGSAVKPGDVLTSYSGKTIEVLNTDAEGRLVLADALAYVVGNHAPAAVLDFATLTGAIIIALGHYGAGVFSNDDALWQRLETAGSTSGDRVWRLPIWEEMGKHLESPFADLRNIADGGAGGGAIAAAAFLREFVGETPWAHVDIAGTAWWEKDRPHLPKGASGFGVRLALDFLARFRD